MRRQIPSSLGVAFSLTAAAILGAVVAAAFEPTATATDGSSIGAEVGPADDHKKHAHPDHAERLNVSGLGAITLPAVVVNASVRVGPTSPEEHHKQHAHGEHTHEEPQGSPDMRVPLTGQVVGIEQGSLTPGTSTAL